MRIPNIAATAAAIGMIAGLVSCQNTSGIQVEKIHTEGIRFCESTYPYDGGLLIANFGTDQLNPLNQEGKGYILYCKDSKTQTIIPADGNMHAPKGMFERSGILYICDVNKVNLYDIKTGEHKGSIQMPEGNLFVNDMAACGNTLYISVTNTGKIFKADITDPAAPGTPEEWAEVPGANGLLTDNGVMYIASYPPDGNTTDANVIYKIDNLNNPAPVKIINIPGQYDGIAFTADKKHLIVTNWAPAGLSLIDLRTGEKKDMEIQLDEAMTGPADITSADGKIYIPDLPGSRVITIRY